MTIRIKLKKDKTLRNGEHPIVLCIEHKKERAFVWLGISCSEELWDFKNNAPKRHHPNKELIENIIAQTLNTYRTKLLELVNQKQVVTPHTLIEAVKTATGKEEASRIFPFFDLVVDRLLQAGKVGTATVYKDAKRALKRFASSNNLLFTDIDQAFLNNYELSLRKLNLAETSMSAYFRTLRALFNKAVQEKLVPLNYYPFKEFNISKFNTATKKRAITKEEMKRIAELEIDPASSLSEARRYFLFSFFALGINFIDIAKLQWKNLVQDCIVYTRAKTGRIIQFALLPPTKAIIEHYRPLTGNHPENYIFPILDRLKHLTPLQIDYRVHNVYKRMNRDLKELARLAQVDANLTINVSRHSCATGLRDMGVPIPVISQMLGHRSSTTTEIYLKEFENKVINEANERLLW